MTEINKSLPEVNLDRELEHIISSLPTIAGFGRLAIASGTEQEMVATKINVAVAALQALSDSFRPEDHSK
jgi:hypothetical protein